MATTELSAARYSRVVVWLHAAKVNAAKVIIRYFLILLHTILDAKIRKKNELKDGIFRMEMVIDDAGFGGAKGIGEVGEGLNLDLLDAPEA